MFPRLSTKKTKNSKKSSKKNSKKSVESKTKSLSVSLLLGLCASTGAWAEGQDWIEPGPDGASFSHVHVDTGYVLGLDRFDLDDHTEILGWQLNDSWYFGRQDGEDSGLTLVWQATVNQISLSKDGVRLTRRF